MTSRKQPAIQVGIDIGIRTIKVAVAEAGIVTLIGSFEDLREADPFSVENDVLIQWLKMFIAENDLGGVPAVLGMPGDRFLFFPARIEGSGDPRKAIPGFLEQAAWRAGLPFDDPHFAWWETQRLDGAGAERCLWIGAASRKILASRVHAIQSAGLAPAVIEPDLAGLARVLPKQPGLGRVIVDIGEVSTQVAFIADERMLFLHHIGIGVLSMTQPIALELGIDAEPAFERARRQAQGGSGDPAIEQILEPIYRRLWGEVSRMLSIYGDAAGLPPERAITLIGGGALLLPPRRLAEAAYPILPLEIRNGIVNNPEIRSLSLSEDENRLERYALVIGSSLRDGREPGGLNFLPDGRNRAQAGIPQALRANPLAAAAAIILVTLAIHLILSWSGTRLEKIALAEQGRIRELETLQRKAEKLEAFKARIDEGMRLLESSGRSNAIYPEAILDIGAKITPGLQVSRIEVQQAAEKRADGPDGRARPGVAEPSTAVAIYGAADQTEPILSFLGSLKVSPILRNASIRWMRAEPGSIRGQVQFQIDAMAAKSSEGGS